MRRLLLGLIYCFFLLIFGGCVGPSMGRHSGFQQPPALYNMTQLEELRQRGVKDANVKRFFKEADKIAEENPVTIMDRKMTFAPDAHYYCSISRYSWPSERDPNVYVIKDGKNKS